MSRRAALAILSASLAGCAVLEPAQRPLKHPGGDEGMVVYTVGRLSFEAPVDWPASGDERRVQIASPAGEARIEAEVPGRAFAGEKECLADAEAVLARGSAALTGVRRHPTTFAGRPAITQEADQGPWHGWAWAACDGPTQYRLWFSGLSPMRQEIAEAARILQASARIGAGP
jgi:hypothetical protein